MQIRSRIIWRLIRKRLARVMTSSRAAACHQPVPRGLLVREIEMFHLRVEEIIGDPGHDRRDSAVRDDGDFFDSVVIQSDELEMRDERAEVLPAEERRRVQHDSAQHVMPMEIAGDEAIDEARRRSEIGGLKRPLQFQLQDPVVASQIEIEHWIASVMSGAVYEPRDIHAAVDLHYAGAKSPPCN